MLCLYFVVAKVAIFVTYSIFTKFQTAEKCMNVYMQDQITVECFFVC